MTLALEVKGLNKAFGALAVARDVDLALAPGARHALIGPNGAGKTTFVGMVSGLIRADSGTISLHGEDVTHLAAEQRTKRGLVRTFQVSSLFEKLTVLENVYLAASEHSGASLRLWRAAGKDKQTIERAAAIIERLRLTDDIHHRVSDIAYGRQRLVEIAIALALEPTVLLLDEPAAGIPSSEVGVLMDAVQTLPSHIAILIIEHDMQVVRRLAKEITVLVGGAVLIRGTPSEVMSSDEVKRVYLGAAGTKRFKAGSIHA